MMCTIQGSWMRVTEMFHGRQLTDECVQKARVRKAKERLGGTGTLRSGQSREKVS